MKRLKIFTWHVHGTYLYYLSKGDYDIFIPVNAQRTDGYIGHGTTFPFGRNVIELPIAEVQNANFDCILFQTSKHYLHDQFQVLSAEQRQLPKIFLEHDPPLPHATDSRHVVNDRRVTLVHVTHYNQLMWDNNGVDTHVIDHGVPDSVVEYSGDHEKGIIVVNNLAHRGRKLGLDIFEQVRKKVPIDLIGMNTESLGGLGEVLHPQLPQFLSRYRFFFNPIRYTSLGLAVIEAMMVGVPIVGLATTEMATVFTDGENGIVGTSIEHMVDGMQRLLEDRNIAADIGARGRDRARERFNMERFVKEWKHLFTRVCRQSATTVALN
jgi:glycosyltransferase involved in cell wall biosynthesis